jgi:hypothetical protein
MATVLYGYKISNPAACTAALTTGGALGTGNYSYVVTFVTEFGETGAGTASNTVAATSGQAGSLTGIPVYPQGYVIARNIYRTLVNGTTYYLLATLSNNTATTYLDTAADSSLPTTQPPAASTADSLQTINGYTSFTRPLSLSVTSGVTAHAGGGQANATLLFSQVNIIGTVATAADSVLLPLLNSNLVGLYVQVRNNGANSCAVFPGSGQSINALSANTSLSVATSTTVTFCAVSSTNWQSL